ncbi:MAG: response regulator [Thermoplasmatota archaeon]
MRTGYSLLYVEDSPADTDFVREAFKRVAPEVAINVAVSGKAAFAALALAADRGTLPDIILLALKIPGMDGHEVLSELKKDVRLHHIPVIILTSSRLAEDILRAYDVGANCNLPKPDDALGYQHIATEVRRFWLETALLPNGRGS